MLLNLVWYLKTGAFFSHSGCREINEQLCSSVAHFVIKHKPRGCVETHSSVQSQGSVQLFVTPWTVARRVSLSITNSWSFLKLISIKLVMRSDHLILCRPLSSHLQSFPASGSFPVSQEKTSHQVAKILEFQLQHQSFQ